MTIEALEAELISLPKPERKRIMALLVGLQLREDTSYRQKLADRCDDDSPGHWLTAEELDSRIREIDP